MNSVTDIRKGIIQAIHSDTSALVLLENGQTTLVDLLNGDGTEFIKLTNDMVGKTIEWDFLTIYEVIAINPRIGE